MKRYNICLLIFVFLLIVFTSSSEINLIAQEESNLLVSYSPTDPSDDTVQVVLSNEKVNPDGTVTATINILAGSRITYGLHVFVDEGML